MCHNVNCTINCLIAFSSLIKGASDLISNGLQNCAVREALLEPMMAAMQGCHGAPRNRALPPLLADGAYNLQHHCHSVIRLMDGRAALHGFLAGCLTFLANILQRGAIREGLLQPV